MTAPPLLCFGMESESESDHSTILIIRDGSEEEEMNSSDEDYEEQTAPTPEQEYNWI